MRRHSSPSSRSQIWRTLRNGGERVTGSPVLLICLTLSAVILTAQISGWQPVLQIERATKAGNMLFGFSANLAMRE